MTWRRLASVMVGVAACAPPAPAPVDGRDPCAVASDTSPSRDTVTLSYLEGVVVSNEPVPQNDAERVFFRHTTRTLVRLDCTGRLRPSLAHRWSRDSSGLVWTFELSRPDGQTMVVADAVVAAWEARRNGGIWPWTRMLDARAAGPSTLEARLDTSFAELPAEFALPLLAIGGGPYRPDIAMQSSTGPLAQLTHLVPEHHFFSGPVIRFQSLRRGLDERDLLDLPRVGLLRPADVVVSRNPLVIEYALGKPGFRAIPLPWDRTYVLLSPGALTLTIRDTAAFRRSLSRDVVRTDSRPAEGSFWWGERSCPGTMPLLPMGRQNLVVYPIDDPTARELAERMVATVGGQLRTMGLLPEALSASLAGGEAAMYVIPQPRIAGAGCQSLLPMPSAVSLLPLVDTRAHILVGPAVPSFSIDSDGAFRFEPRGRNIRPPSGP